MNPVGKDVDPTDPSQETYVSLITTFDSDTGIQRILTGD